MRLFITTLTGLACSLLLGCGGEGGENPNSPAPAVTEYASAVARDTEPAIGDAEFGQFTLDNNAFALDAYRETFNLAPTQAVISPLSISSALAMIYAGAGGATKTEMADALHFKLADPELHAGFNRMLSLLDSRNLPAAGEQRALTLNIKNALWPALHGTPSQDFLDTLARHYGAGLYALDYEGDTEGARKAINDQVEDWTEGLIQDLLAPGTIKPDTLLVLTNTIYLYAPWQSPFIEALTAPAPFENADGSSSSVPTMRNDSRVLHGDLQDAEILALPFRDEALEMVFIEPKADLATYLAGLDPNSLTAELTALTPSRAMVSVPKFSLQFDLDAGAVLRARGMQQAFENSADFSGIGMGGLKITHVAHKAHIEVTEAGTEAAAATAVVGGPTSAPTLEVKIDRPFLFLIFDRPSGTILFMGHVASFE